MRGTPSVDTPPDVPPPFVPGWIPSGCVTRQHGMVSSETLERVVRLMKHRAAATTRTWTVKTVVQVADQQFCGTPQNFVT